MKRTYKTPKAIHVDFQYTEQVVAASSEGVAPYGDPQKIGVCQQSNPASCMVFWSDSAVCQMEPFSLR